MGLFSAVMLVSGRVSVKRKEGEGLGMVGEMIGF